DKSKNVPEEPAEETPVEEAVEAEEPAPAEVPEEEAETETEAEAEPEAAEEPEPAPSVTDATIRFEGIPANVSQAHSAQPIGEEEEDEPVLPPAPEEKSEPYSEEWEPEYEQPISEYVPSKPIQFPSRSRLKEIKKKLVNGPERLYYQLSEKGQGSIQLAMLFNILVLLLTAAGTVLYTVGIIGENRIKLMVFVQFFCMLLAALLGSGRLIEGLADLMKKRFTLNTMLVFTFVLCLTDGIIGLYELRVPCCAAFSLQMTMSLWNAYHDRTTKLGQLDTMRKAVRLDSVYTVEDYVDGKKGILRGEGQVEDFMDTYDKPAALEKVQSVYALVALCLSVAAGVTAGILHGISTGVQVAAVTTLAAVPASMHIIFSRPMAVLERRHHRVGTVLCGWQGVEQLCGKAVFPLMHRDLFPGNTVKLNGVKFFGNRQPDEIIAYAAALVETDGGVLAPLFTQLLDSHNGRHYPAEEFVIYEEGGIGAVINGEPVLAGSLSFLKELGVELPEGIRVNNAVCVAIDGELTGLFAFAYDKDKSAAAGITSLCGYRKLAAVIAGSSFMMDGKLLSERFGIRSKRLRFATDEELQQMEAKKPEETPAASALITGLGLLPYVYAVTGARTLKNAAKAGLIVHMIGGILGIVMMGVLAVIGATHLLSPANMLFYELVW
ncbi:MAG: hypothetical protein J6Q54_07645, partial [Oscillospiraceae bacterium]|nr:hypothetical protein [Oscillospiraceae bacterium]